jgi:hypothetical protein
MVATNRLASAEAGLAEAPAIYCDQNPFLAIFAFIRIDLAS